MPDKDEGIVRISCSELQRDGSENFINSILCKEGVPMEYMPGGIRPMKNIILKRYYCDKTQDMIIEWVKEIL